MNTREGGVSLNAFLSCSTRSVNLSFPIYEQTKKVPHSIKITDDMQSPVTKLVCFKLWDSTVSALKLTKVFVNGKKNTS